MPFVQQSPPDNLFDSVKRLLTENNLRFASSQTSHGLTWWPSKGVAAELTYQPKSKISRFRLYLTELFPAELERHLALAVVAANNLLSRHNADTLAIEPRTHGALLCTNFVALADPEEMAEAIFGGNIGERVFLLQRFRRVFLDTLYGSNLREMQVLLAPFIEVMCGEEGNA